MFCEEAEDWPSGALGCFVCLVRSIDSVSIYYQPPELLILSKLRMIKATRPAERSIKDEKTSGKY
jgi:hypothetical protein